MALTISTRGQSFAEKRPVFFEVLDDLWNPESNPNGIVNVGLAENVNILHLLMRYMSNTDYVLRRP